MARQTSDKRATPNGKTSDKSVTQWNSVGAKILTQTNAKRLTPNDKRTTLDPGYPCGVCGAPAMAKEGDRLRCPSCWLKDQADKIKPIDRGGYYPVT